jgi:hypothetical protein
MYRAGWTAILSFATACNNRPLKVINVDAYRCGGCTSISAPALLLVDVREFRSTSRFDLELVDARGIRIDSAPGIKLPIHKLSPGAYYLRLHENGVLKREYAIRSR